MLKHPSADLNQSIPAVWGLKETHFMATVPKLSQLYLSSVMQVVLEYFTEMSKHWVLKSQPVPQKDLQF